ncbi:MAG: hypothetical protein WAO22_09105 [bacterium]|jgi:hypothetical protein|nr:hypothetical protein [Bacillota bacterium]
MAIVYTKKEIVGMVDEYLQPVKVNKLHCKGFVNYRGITSDTKEKYTEVIAAYLLEHLGELKYINLEGRTGSYSVFRDGTTPLAADGRKWEQEEQRIAMRLFNKKGLPPFSEVFHYQTPLKDGRGIAIDLLARDEKYVYILELKRPSSKETLLRCILEIYTYYRMVNYGKLLADFEIENNPTLRKGVLVFKNSRAHKDFSDPNVRRLMQELEVDFFMLDKSREEIVEKYYSNEAGGQVNG